ncbi:MAG TPA: GntR family transcriptional regulator [Actinomycetaceae bacterium]|nr:GntR family transcriptional regulator [Actinomycetaceae bacterium]
MPIPPSSTRPPISKSEAVYRELRARIIAGRYTAGYRIVLDQIARELGVSPVPVREAIRRLEAERLVNFTRNVGAEVAGLDVEGYADAMQTLAYLEGAATSLAADHMSEELLADARATNQQLRSVFDAAEFEPRTFTELNARFHRKLCSACPNRHMLDLLEREWEFVAVIRRDGQFRRAQHALVSVEEHEQILDLIAGDVPRDEIEKAVRDHKMRSMRDLVSGG